MTPRDAIVLCSGPSFGDFDAAELQSCGAVLYGCGHVSRGIVLDHYCVGDFTQHKKHIPERGATTIWVNTGVRLDMHAEGWDHSAYETVPPGTHGGSSGLMTLSLACQGGHDRVFLLGLDGYCDSYAVHRGQFHDRGLHPKIWDYREKCGGFHINDDDLTQIHIATLLQGQYTNLWNLSPHSVLPLPVPSFIEHQPLSHLDRHGKLIIVSVPKSSGIYAVVHLAQYWQECHPRTPIVVIFNSFLPQWHRPGLILRKEMPSDAELRAFNSVDVITFW